MIKYPATTFKIFMIPVIFIGVLAFPIPCSTPDTIIIITQNGKPQETVFKYNVAFAIKSGFGLNILRKIAYDITMVFSDLGIGKPELDINHGQMKLTITDPSTREYLKKIRDIAYGFKR